MPGMFDQDNAAQQEQPVAKTAQEIYEELVGEGKKYHSVEDLAKAYFHADSHIKRLEQENEEYRVKVQAAASVDDILARLKPSQEAPITESHEKTPRQDSAAAPEDVESIVQKALEQKLKERESVSNQQKVTQALREKFGDAAGRVFQEKSAELGLDLEQLAAQSPSAVLAIFGTTAPAGSNAKPLGGDTTSSTVRMPEAGTRAHAEYLYDTGKISRDEKYRLLHDYAKDPAQYNKQRSYK